MGGGLDRSNRTASRFNTGFGRSAEGMGLDLDGSGQFTATQDFDPATPGSTKTMLRKKGGVHLRCTVGFVQCLQLIQIDRDVFNAVAALETKFWHP